MALNPPPSGADEWIVITSIAAPTLAVRRFAALPNRRLIVVGDRKTPPNWSHPGVDYYSLERQSAEFPRLSRAIPENHYARKLVGYAAAIRAGAKVIYDSDDDNIPARRWEFPAPRGRFPVIRGRGWVNIYRRYSTRRLWPRGFPLGRIMDSLSEPLSNDTERSARIGVWQGLVHGDTDVDAIYRLVLNRPVRFRHRGPLVLDRGVVCPFNSQNTCFQRPAFPLLFLPATVTFRFTDILRGLVAQPVLWAAGLRLGFCDANATQIRNPHNLEKDFQQEVPMYLNAEKSLEIAQSTAEPSRSIADNLSETYAALRRAEIVTDQELNLLNCWLLEIEPK